jgi:hypothetical protein
MRFPGPPRSRRLFVPPATHETSQAGALLTRQMPAFRSPREQVVACARRLGALTARVKHARGRQVGPDRGGGGAGAQGQRAARQRERAGASQAKCWSEGTGRLLLERASGQVPDRGTQGAGPGRSSCWPACAVVAGTRASQPLDSHRAHARAGKQGPRGTGVSRRMEGGHSEGRRRRGTDGWGREVPTTRGVRVVGACRRLFLRTEAGAPAVQRLRVCGAGGGVGGGLFSKRCSGTRGPPARQAAAWREWGPASPAAHKESEAGAGLASEGGAAGAAKMRLVAV